MSMGSMITFDGVMGSNPLTLFLSMIKVNFKWLGDVTFDRPSIAFRTSVSRNVSKHQSKEKERIIEEFAD